MNVSDLIRKLNTIKKKQPNAEVLILSDKDILHSKNVAIGYTDTLESVFSFQEDKVVKLPTKELNTPFILLDATKND